MPDQMAAPGRRRGGRLATEMLVAPISHLPAPPRHRLVATRAILEEAARALGGEAVALANGDVALVGAREGAGPKLRRIAALLSRLWDLPIERFLIAPSAPSIATAPLSLPPSVAAPPPPRSLHLLAREATAVIAAPGVPPRLLHRTLRLSPGGLLGLAPPGADAPTLRHVAARLEPELLAELAQAPPPTTPEPVVLALGLPALASAGFFRLAAAWQERGQALGIELDLTEAALHPALFATMRGALRARHVSLILAGLGAALLPCAAAEALEADMLLVDWSAELAEAPAAACLAALRQRIGAGRLVLAGVDAAGLEFGQAAGLTGFRGPRIDRLLERAARA